MHKYLFWTVVFFAAIFLACNSPIDDPEDNEQFLNLYGSGEYTFSAEFVSGEKEMKVFYHIPESSRKDAAVLIALHGNGRDAKATRDAFISIAGEKGVVVIVPEFSSDNFPGGDAYNLGNIFVDGDDPSAETLNPVGDWTFSVIEPIFADFKIKTGISTLEYDLFGHSAGAQVAHRIALFLPGDHLNRVACSAAGWYTVPDNQIRFPYGLQLSTEYQSDLEYFFSRKIMILVGTNDIDPDSYGLRHNEYADAQGLNRFDRAQHFYIQSLKIAQESGQNQNWEYFSVPGVGHELEPMANFSMDRLYPE